MATRRKVLALPTIASFLHFFSILLLHNDSLSVAPIHLPSTNLLCHLLQLSVILFEPSAPALAIKSSPIVGTIVVEATAIVNRQIN